MNVLIASYACIDNNSGYQILELANGLKNLGVNVFIAAPKLASLQQAHVLTDIPILHFREVLSGDKKLPFFDILHAWTPRENVRRFVTTFWIKNPTRVIVHLEDNEDVLRKRILGDTLSVIIPDGLSCPSASRWLLEAADGATIIVPSLTDLIPYNKPCIKLPPIIDHNFFAPSTHSPLSTKEKSEPIKIGYFGNVSAVNIEDFLLLCKAVRLINQWGYSAILLKTGTIAHEMRHKLPVDELLPMNDYGFVDRSRMPYIMSKADVCVQPGNADDFNNYRMPSKIPEILSMGIPLITGSCNIGSILRNHQSAFLIDKMNPYNLAEMILWVISHSEQSKVVASNGVHLSRKLFSQELISKSLWEFYSTFSPGKTLLDLASTNKYAQVLLTKLKLELLL